MVGGSGRHTAPAVNRHKPYKRPKIRAAVPIGAVLGLSACVYFNAVYNANRLFDEGREDIESGRIASGEASLASSIEKAERVVEDNPDSRWADDAQRLIVRARLLRREWPEALEAGERLMSYASSRRDSAEAAGYMGFAEARLEHPRRADSLLSFALEVVRDEKLRARFLYGRGLANRALGRIEAADADLRGATSARPNWLDPQLERILMLAEADRASEAAEDLRALLQADFAEFEQRDIIETVTFLSERHPNAARNALAGVEESGLPREGRARLTKLRGDLEVAVGRIEQARADYQTAASIDPDSRAAVDAKLALVRLDFPRLSSVDELHRHKSRIDDILRSRIGRSNSEVIRYRDILERMIYWIEIGNLGYVLAAETARDQLGAPALARKLFVRYADEQPTSVWAPKALLAAIALGDRSSPRSDGEGAGPGPEELRRRVREQYPDSPYLRAVTADRPEGRFSYEDLEQGLQRQLERLRKLTEDRLRERRSGGSGRDGGG